MTGPRTLIVAVGLLLGLSACGMEPFDAPRSQEIPPGPGVFTGQSGAFTISAPSRSERQPPAQSQGAPTSSGGAATSTR